MGVSCGDLRGGPATLPNGEGSEKESQGIPAEDSADSESPAVTDPSDLDDPVDGGSDDSDSAGGTADGLRVVMRVVSKRSPRKQSMHPSISFGWWTLLEAWTMRSR